MIYDQLTFAREYRGLTQTELAKRVSGLSQSNLSRFEKGLGVLSEGVIDRIMDVLDFPKGFLRLNIRNAATSENYRKKAKLNTAARNRINRFTRLAAYTLDRLFEEVETPDFDIPQIDLDDGTTPEEAAQIVRRKFRLGDDPVKDICNLLERNGVFIYEWDCGYEDFDGVSFVTDAGNRLIIINGGYPADRKRFTLAHELGHLVMHASSDFVILPARDKEREADAFAGEFLLPRDTLRNQLLGIKFKDLPALKRRWLVSMQTIARKARDTGAVDGNAYTNMMVQFSRNHWRKKEPVEVYIDRPVVIEQTKSVALEQIGYTIPEMSSYMHLPADVIGNVLEGRCNTLRMVRPVPA